MTCEDRSHVALSVASAAAAYAASRQPDALQYVAGAAVCARTADRDSCLPELCTHAGGMWSCGLQGLAVRGFPRVQEPSVLLDVLFEVPW